jgi:hypothetical protein
MIAVALRLSAGAVELLFAYTSSDWPALSVDVKLMLVGVIAIAEIVTKAVAVAVEVTLSSEAVMVAVPLETPVSVALPVPLTVTTVSSLLDQETPVVK